MADSQDKVERILKEIHLFFANCPSLDGQPNQVVVDRKGFMDLLDRLNRSIYAMMNQYEQTRQSRAQAEREFRKKADSIVESASSQAEDVYAASMIYTQDMLGQIRDIMDQTSGSMQEIYDEFISRIGEQKNLLRTHETELVGQLSDMKDTDKYLSIIENMNYERRKQEREKNAAKEAGEAPRPTRKIEKPVPAPALSEEPEIKINKDAAYFKWKEAKSDDEKVDIDIEFLDDDDDTEDEHESPDGVEESSMSRTKSALAGLLGRNRK